MNKRIMPRYALVLYPLRTDFTLEEKSVLIRTLAETGLTGAGLGHAPHAWYAGEEFLSHISFLGCSPYIRLQPDNDNCAFTYIELIEHPQATFLSGVNLKAPRCRTCRQVFALNGMHDLEATTQLTCTNCQQAYSLPDWDWRQSACLTGVAVWIWEVFEGEAVPGDKLLRSLAQATAVDWSYCYIAVPDRS